MVRSRNNRIQKAQKSEQWSDDKEAKLKALLDDKETGDKQ
ncbi:hypothetical protein JCM19240_6661 [Vibrio maritimus]|uniref:Uncharacterized protein n=1 Tax=Vibrio maritimus TaxID=990268 RepID=A0A090T3B2_9VIBR|nr:hypothetical protein JCM19240_6661 [Vibrio maritimus]